VKIRYRRSVLGVAWSQLAPLSMIAIMSLVFGHVLQLNIPNYAAFLFVSLLPWTWFQTAIVAGTQSVVGGRDLVRQPGFPVPMLPVISISSTFVNYALALPVMFVWIGATTGRIPVTAVALPLIIAVQFLITLGPCYVLSAINVMFRDIGHIVEIALLPLFYATPVFYLQPPKRFHLVYELNPLTHLMSAYRDALLYGRWPKLMPLVVLFFIGIVLVATGRKVFDRLSHLFPGEL
jgi:lipopolysaccharide transport system permease protein